MSILELLKRALEWDDPYEDMPDYGFILEHLGLSPDDDPQTVREAIEMEIADLEPDAVGDGDGDAGEQ